MTDHSVHTCRHVHTHMCTHIDKHTHTHIENTHIHTHTSTHTPPHTHTPKLRRNAKATSVMPPPSPKMANTGMNWYCAFAGSSDISRSKEAAVMPAKVTSQITASTSCVLAFHMMCVVPASSLASSSSINSTPT